MSSSAPNERPEAPPPISLDQNRAGGEEDPQEATQGHPETAHPHPALLKEGREKKGRPGMHDFRRSPCMKKGHRRRGRKSLKDENFIFIK